MRQRAAASLLYQSKYAEAAFRNLLKLIFLKIVGRILAFYSFNSPDNSFSVSDSKCLLRASANTLQYIYHI